MAGVKRLIKMEACIGCVKWVAKQPSLEVAWRNCDRGDWMLWLLGKLSGPPESESRRKLVLASCKCMMLSLHYVNDEEERPQILIETAERRAKGEAYAAYATAKAADAAYGADARKRVLRECAEIVREFYPHYPTRKEVK